MNRQCKTCGDVKPISEFTKGRGGWYLHKCKKGLLCSGCNWGLGHFKDDPARLDRAIDYLKLTGEGNRNGME